jgi:hypothetical protein
MGRKAHKVAAPELQNQGGSTHPIGRLGIECNQQLCEVVKSLAPARIATPHGKEISVFETRRFVVVFTYARQTGMMF